MLIWAIRSMPAPGSPGRGFANVSLFRYDGGNPANPWVGHRVNVTGGDDTLVVRGNTNVNNLKFIRGDIASGTVAITLEKV